MQIRPVTEADLPILALLGRVTFRDTFAEYFDDPLNLAHYLRGTFSVEKLRGSLGRPINMYWVAWIDELPVGYCKVKLPSAHPAIEGERQAQLQKIYVLQDFIQDGVGKEMLQIALTHIRESGADKLWLMVAQFNHRAIGFYERTGFTQTAADTWAIGPQSFDFWVMEKNL